MRVAWRPVGVFEGHGDVSRESNGLFDAGLVQVLLDLEIRLPRSGEVGFPVLSMIEMAHFDTRTAIP